jgi:glycosyltransferase involved in cell wall biosynthesis
LLRERDDTDVVLVGQFPDLANWQAAQAGEVSRWLHFPAVAPEDRWPVLAACDIAVAPAGNAGAEAAGEIVWLEAAAAAIPTVASDTATARETIVAGETGLLAADAEGWHAALAALCANADLRRRIGVWARDQVLRERSPEALASQWRALPAVPAAPVPRRPRILVVNVFFSPQSLGGATRVVEDNVRHLDRAGDYDLAVFCADEAFGTSGVLHTSRFGNVPVFRAEVPPRDDRLAADPAILPAFRRVLDLFRPDLVHFHCMQRLTASPLSECLVRGLPYVVTVHDGWWISPDQFLVDGNGLLHVPGPDLFAGLGEDPAAATAWLLRRQTLAPLLAGAARVLTVSEPFAQICRQAGMPEIAAVPNGVPDLPLPLPADPDIGGPLRLAHLGGRALHKGAHLVEAALRRGQYGNLSLLMVDGQVPPGELVQTRWGASDVVLCPPWPQDAIADLYGRTDVLLAPSIWPESFGLVAREAHHFGCWVVASDCGAMGEDVVPGLNGFLVDPADGAALDRILVKLDAAPHAYRRGTIAAPAAAARSMSAQANDLARIYAAILDQ